MAAGTGKWFGQVLLAAFNKEIDLLDDTIKGLLTTSLYTPDQDTHKYLSDVTNEVPGTGNYTTGGQQLANDTLTYTAATNTLKYDADDLSWPNSTITNARHCIIYDDTPATAATKPLLGFITFDADLSSNAGSLTIVFDTNGVLASQAQ